MESSFECFPFCAYKYKGCQRVQDVDLEEYVVVEDECCLLKCLA